MSTEREKMYLYFEDMIIVFQMTDILKNDKKMIKKKFTWRIYYNDYGK